MRVHGISDGLWIGGAIAALLAAGLGVRHELAPAPEHRLVRQNVNDGRALAVRGQWMGAADARVTIVEFSDFQCPFCRRLHATLRTLRERYPRTVRVAFRHYPLANHNAAYPAAIASECAAAQGRFEAFADVLFADQDSIGRLDWAEFAQRANVADTTAFNRCVKDPHIRLAVDADIAAGRTIPMRGTPALIVGNQMLVGAAPIDSILTFLRENGVSP